MNSKPGGKPTPAPWSDKAAKAGRPGKEKPVESRFKAHHDRMEGMRVVMVQEEEELVRLGGLADKARDAAEEADAAYDAQDSLVSARRVALEVEEGVMASIKLELAGQQVRDLSSRAALGICQKLVFSLEGAELPVHARPILLEVGSAIAALLGKDRDGVSGGGLAGRRKRILSEPGSEEEQDPGQTPNPWGVKAESVNSDDMAGCEPPANWEDQLDHFNEMDLAYASEECPEDACSDISGAILGPRTPREDGPEVGHGVAGTSDVSEAEWEPEGRVDGDWVRAGRYGQNRRPMAVDGEESQEEGLEQAVQGSDQGGGAWEQAGRRGQKGRRVSSGGLSAPPVFAAGHGVPAPKTPPVKAGRSPESGDAGGRSRSPTGDPASGATRSTATGGSPVDGTPSAIRRAGRPRKEVETQSTTLDRWAVRRASVAQEPMVE